MFGFKRAESTGSPQAPPSDPPATTDSSVQEIIRDKEMSKVIAIYEARLSSQRADFMEEKMALQAEASRARESKLIAEREMARAEAKLANSLIRALQADNLLGSESARLRIEAAVNLVPSGNVTPISLARRKSSPPDDQSDDEKDQSSVDLLDDPNEESRPKAFRGKFKWLRTSKTVPFGAKNVDFPDELIRHITTFLNDETLFVLRGTSLMFYDAYYGQSVKKEAGSWECARRKFRAVRAVRLAKMGRVFPNVEYLDMYSRDRDFDYGLRNDELECINPRCFPSLEAIYCGTLDRRGTLKCLPGHPRMTAIAIPCYDEQAEFITEEKYPNLLTLRCYGDGALPDEMPPHSQLTRLELNCDEIPWMSITRDTYPSLEVLSCQDDVPELTRVELEEAGIVIEN